MRKLLGLVSLLILAGCGCASFNAEMTPSSADTEIQDASSNVKILWDAGFTSREAQWLGNGLRDRGEEITPAAAQEYRNKCYATKESLAEFRGWMDNQLSFEESAEWSARGFAPADAAIWKNSGRTPEQALTEIRKQAQMQAEQVKSETAQLQALGYDVGREKSLRDLARANPYAIKGQCFSFVEKCQGQQLLNRHSGLYVLGRGGATSLLALLDFNQSDALPVGVPFKCRAIGAGAYQYQSLAGLQTVPVLRVISVTDWKTLETTFLANKNN